MTQPKSLTEQQQIRYIEAGVVILLTRLAHLMGFDVTKLVDEKMAVNRLRTWERDGTGCGYHVKAAE